MSLNKANSDKIAVCVVGDFFYLRKYLNKFIENIRNEGSYKNEIIVLTSYFCPTFFIRIQNKKNVKFLRFKKIRFDKATNESLKNLDTNGQPNRHINKNFQWHKINLFHEKIKNWDFILYLDINLTIHRSLEKLLDLKVDYKLLAREDGYPNFDWKLSVQFDSNHPKFSNLQNDFNLEIKDYFQTGLMYFDTKIIETTSVTDLINLVKKYPLSRNNEQGIMNLYFIYIKNCYKPLPEFVGSYKTYYYWKDSDDILITKQLVPKYK